MGPRAPKTAYFLNRAINRLALVAAGIRFPATAGIWVMVADAVRAPAEATDLLALIYPESMKANPVFVALLTEFDVSEFEQHFQRD